MDNEDWNDGKIGEVISPELRRSVFVLGCDGQGYLLPSRKIGFDLRRKPPKPRVRVKAGWEKQCLT